jgi:hypothetical protein
MNKNLYRYINIIVSFVKFKKKNEKREIKAQFDDFFTCTFINYMVPIINDRFIYC